MGRIKDAMIVHQDITGMEDDYYVTDLALLDMAIEQGYFTGEEDND